MPCSFWLLKGGNPRLSTIQRNTIITGKIDLRRICFGIQLGYYNSQANPIIIPKPESSKGPTSRSFARFTPESLSSPFTPPIVSRDPSFQSVAPKTNGRTRFNPKGALKPIKEGKPKGPLEWTTKCWKGSDQKMVVGSINSV